MNRYQVRSNLCLLLAAGIWGFAFVAQRVGVQHIGAFAFNAIRFALGAVSLLPLLLLNRRRDKTGNTRLTLQAGFLSGLVLFVAASLQQVGLIGTDAGKGGFITSLYLILVPLLGLLLRRPVRPMVWLGAVCALAGLFLLCVTGDWTIAGSDLLILGCALFFAIHILAIDYFSTRVDGLKLAFFQFLTCSVLSLAVAVPTESITVQGIGLAAIPLLYSGICSTGIAYTLQIFGQKNAEPASAAIILSTETLFAMLGGYLLLQERLGLRGLSGAALMLAGIVLTLDL